MFYFFPKFRLRTTIVVPFILQTVVTVGLVGYLSFRNGQESVNNVASQLRTELTNRISDKLVSYYTEVPHVINQLNALSFLQGTIDVDEAKGEAPFWQQMRTYSSISMVYCGNEQGAFFGIGRLSEQDRSNLSLQFSNQLTGFIRQDFGLDELGNRTQRIKTFNEKPYDPRIRSWYKAAKASDRSVWSEIYLDFSTLLPTVTASIPVYSQADKSFLGSCAVDFYLPQEVSNFLRKLKIGKTGTAFIIERSGQLVATSTVEPMFKGKGENAERLFAVDSANLTVKATGKLLSDRFSSFGQIQSLQQLHFSLDGKEQYVEIAPFQDRNLDWLIVIVIPEADFMEEIYTNTYNTVLMCVIGALGVTILIGIFTTRWVIGPIQRVTQASNEIAQGNLEQQIDASNIIEISSLSQSFNSMAGQLKDSFTSLRQSEEKVRLANTELETRVERRTAELHQEKERSEQLLLNILPGSIADRLKKNHESPAEHFEEVTILFADIVGFTSLSVRMEPLQLVEGLNQIFSAFDHLTEKYGLEKIKTIGDAYMVVGGLPVSRPDHAEAIANMALDMQAHMQEVEEVFGESLQIRIGINTGPVIAGVIGTKKFIYDLWGDAVNIASRMESHSNPGCIQITPTTYAKLSNEYLLEERGIIEVKGRGEMMTYWLLGRKF